MLILDATLSVAPISGTIVAPSSVPERVADLGTATSASWPDALKGECPGAELLSSHAGGCLYLHDSGEVFTHDLS
jgi:hypothetical protein